MQIVSFREEAVPPDLRVQVLHLHAQAWPPADTSPAATAGALAHDPELRPLSMLLVEGRIVLAVLDILSKQIAHAGHRYAAGGLSTVVTRREARGRGHGRRLVAAARDMMIAQGLDLGLFTCDRPLQAFYESAGWRLLPGTVLIGGTPSAPFPSDQPGFGKVTMAGFFSPLARREQASFHYARVGLYPGEIDRLW